MVNWVTIAFLSARPSLVLTGTFPYIVLCKLSRLLRVWKSQEIVSFWNTQTSQSRTDICVCVCVEFVCLDDLHLAIVLRFHSRLRNPETDDYDSFPMLKRATFVTAKYCNLKLFDAMFCAAWRSERAYVARTCTSYRAAVERSTTTWWSCWSWSTPVK